LSRVPSAADSLSLDRLIREGPPDDDVISALSTMRFKVLDQGIKTDTDGMVSCTADRLALRELTVSFLSSPRVVYTYG